MATLGSLVVKVGADISGLDRGLRSAGESISNAGRSMMKIGAGMTAAVSVPLLAVASSAITASGEMNALMANVASLGIESDRVDELKGSVQSLAIATGKSTEDMAGGLYQVISAFGDTADTVGILEINARAAAAGLATTEEAINLTSAVTKGYGDTSEAAVGHVADLALLTVQLGQTTFPELAASMGKVVPIAANLGASQEELFAVMATLTGVTGNAAEVSTQLRGAMQSLMVPTEDTKDLMADLGFESGEAMIAELGLVGSLEAMVDAAEASGTPLQSYIGSIEGQTLALALAGPQAEVFEKKLSAMGDAAGATDAAFKAQTEGINASGFAMEQMKVKAEVMRQKLGDGLAPALGQLLEMLEPVIDRALELADQFANADSKTQMFTVAIGAIAVAAGPVLIVLGAVVTAIGAIGLPITLIIAAVAALAAAWATDFGGIRTKTLKWWETVEPKFNLVVAWLGEKIPAALSLLKTLWIEGWTVIKDVFSAIWDWLKPTWETFATWMADDLPGALSTLELLWTSGWSAIQTAFDTMWNLLVAAWEKGVEFLTVTLPNAVDSFKAFLDVLSLPNPFAIITGALDAVQSGVASAQAAVQGFKDWLSGLSISNPFAGFTFPEPPGWLSNFTGGNKMAALPPGLSGLSMAGAAPGGAGAVTVNINATVNNDMDVERLAYRVAETIQRRRR